MAITLKFLCAGIKRVVGLASLEEESNKEYRCGCITCVPSSRLLVQRNIDSKSRH